MENDKEINRESPQPIENNYEDHKENPGPPAEAIEEDNENGAGKMMKYIIPVLVIALLLIWFLFKE